MNDEELEHLRLKCSQLESITELQERELRRLRSKLMKLEMGSSISKLIKVINGKTRKKRTRSGDKGIFTSVGEQRAFVVQ